MDAKGMLVRAGAYVRTHHIGFLALFVALGGTAFAAHTKVAPKNSVATKSIKKAAVTNPKLAPNAVDGSKVADGSLSGADLNLGTLGTVPNASSAAHATKADEAAKAGEAAHAVDSDRLGGAEASSYVKFGDQLSGGDLRGTYAAPTLRGAGSGTAGASTLFAPTSCGSSSVSGPSVTVEVPSSGYVEVLAATQFQNATGNGLTACLVEDGGAAVQIMSSTSVSAESRYTVPNKKNRTTNSALADWIPIFTTPGAHAFKLTFGRTGANSGTNQVSNRLLLVRAIP